MPKLPSYRNQSIDLFSKSIDWFRYDGNFGVNDFLAGVICDVTIYADEITLYSESVRASGLWQQTGWHCGLEQKVVC